ncbi:MAG: helix-turn-helix domain-containing protein [Puniceicoccaceae bacterium]
MMTTRYPKSPAALRELRVELGYSQEQFAHKLGLSFATVNRWENGKTKPSSLARRQIRNFIEQSISEGKIPDHYFEL